MCYCCACAGAGLIECLNCYACVQTISMCWCWNDWWPLLLRACSQILSMRWWWADMRAWFYDFGNQFWNYWAWMARLRLIILFAGWCKIALHQTHVLVRAKVTRILGTKWKMVGLIFFQANHQEMVSLIFFQANHREMVGLIFFSSQPTVRAHRETTMQI